MIPISTRARLPLALQASSTSRTDSTTACGSSLAPELIRWRTAAAGSPTRRPESKAHPRSQNSSMKRTRLGNTTEIADILPLRITRRRNTWRIRLRCPSEMWQKSSLSCGGLASPPLAVRSADARFDEAMAMRWRCYRRTTRLTANRAYRRKDLFGRADARVYCIRSGESKLTPQYGVQRRCLSSQIWSRGCPYQDVRAAE